MNSGPPPLFQSKEAVEPCAFARHAANACLAAPLLVFILGFCISTLHPDHKDPSAVPLYLVTGLLAAGFSAVGFVCGLLSIVLASPGQRGSVLARAVPGFVLLAVLAAIAMPNFVRARTQVLERRQALEQVNTAAADLRAKAATTLASGKPGAIADIQPLRNSLSDAAEKSSGETAALLKSSELFLARIQPVQQTFSQVTKELTSAKVLSTSRLTQRSQIQERKALVQKFLKANDACKDFVLHGEAYYSNQLAGGAISPAQVETALRAFRKSSSAHAPLMLAIRDADNEMGKAMLDVLDLFDNEWDNWSYDDNTQVVRFQNRATLNQYNQLMARIKQAGQTEATASKRLAALMSSGPSASQL